MSCWQRGNCAPVWVPAVPTLTARPCPVFAAHGALPGVADGHMRPLLLGVLALLEPTAFLLVPGAPSVLVGPGLCRATVRAALRARPSTRGTAPRRWWAAGTGPPRTAPPGRTATMATMTATTAAAAAGTRTRPRTAGAARRAATLVTTAVAPAVPGLAPARRVPPTATLTATATTTAATTVTATAAATVAAAATATAGMQALPPRVAARVVGRCWRPGGRPPPRRPREHRGGPPGVCSS